MGLVTGSRKDIRGGHCGHSYHTYLSQSVFVPVLTYEIFQPYRLPEKGQVSMIVVANEGRSVATNLRVTIQTVGEIRDYDYDRFEEITVEPQANALVLKVKRLLHGTQTTVYIGTATGEKDPIRGVLITSDQVVGQKKMASSTQMEPPFYFMAFLFVVMFVFHLDSEKRHKKALDLANARWMESHAGRFGAQRDLDLTKEELKKVRTELEKVRASESTLRSDYGKLERDFDKIVAERDELKRRKT